MKYLIVGAVVVVVVMGFLLLWGCTMARGQADERYELMLRRQWREDHQ